MEPVWTQSKPTIRFPALEGDLEVDVVVVGAGMTGLSAAATLKDAGARVAVLEARYVAGGESSRTTAHLTAVRDLRYASLRRKLGRKNTALVAAASMAAIQHISSWVDRLGIDCGFTRLPGYLFTEDARQLASLEEDAAAALDAGLRARVVRDVPLPFKTVAAMRVEDQGQLHPVRYLRALADFIHGDGSAIYEDTPALSFEDGEPCVVVTRRGTVRAGAVVVATDTPVSSKYYMQLSFEPMRTYVVALRTPDPLPGLFWDTAEPYHYLRTQRWNGGHLLIIGGEDHPVGEEPDTRRHLQRLTEYTHARFGGAVEYRWSGQVLESLDGLPLIGRTPRAKHIFVGSGYSGTGMTDGTIAARVLADLALGRKNDWADVFSPLRFSPTVAKEVLGMGVKMSGHFVADRLARPDLPSVRELVPGQGALLTVAGQKVAAYRDETGRLHALSPKCTHMGCIVQWNGSERSWDCPCHGSRFEPTGAVLHGPAVRGLPELPLEEELEKEAEVRAERRDETADPSGEVGAEPSYEG